MSTDLTADDKQSLEFLVKEAEIAQAAVNAYARYLGQKYELKQGDQLLANGQIYRAPTP